MLTRYLNHLWQEMSPRGRKTFPWDLVRGCTEGALIAGQVTFSLLVAIQFFHASTLQKSLIAGANAIGLVLSLGYESWSPVLGRNTLRGAVPALGTAIGFSVAALANTAWTYTLGIFLAGVCSRLSLPIITGIYRTNYRGSVRGQVFGITVLVMAIATLLSNLGGGALLEQSLTHYRSIAWVLAALALVGGFSIFRMPAAETSDTVRINPLACFQAVKEHPLFGYMLAAWFIYGMANLSLVPQRFEYLSQPEYGLSLSAGQVALVLGVAAEAIRLPMIPIMARLFDRFNFIKLRIMLSICFFCHIALFYHTQSLALVVVGSCLMGMTYAGGAIAWNLWVTKFSAPEDTAKFMALNTFLTGIRGTFGPYLGYVSVKYLGLSTTAWIAAGLVATSICMLIPIRNLATRRK